jgi:hypothetical protein
MAYKPTAGDLNEAMTPPTSTFEVCPECRSPASCKAAKQCALDAFAPKPTFDRVNKGKGFK